MKKFAVGLSVVVAASGIWYAYQWNNIQIKTKDGSAGIIAGARDNAEPPEIYPHSRTIKGTVSQSQNYVKTEVPPPGYEGFYDIPESQCLRLVTDAMNSKDSLDGEEYAFFKAELFNRKHWPTTRNNMANVLVNARDKNGRHPDPGLHEAFITMLEDETEDPTWRDYCIQFLSAHLANSSDPKRVKAVITKYSDGDGALAGTALVQMHLQDQDNTANVDETFNEKLEHKLEDPQVLKQTKLTIIGIMGQRADIKHLPLIRKYARQDEDAGLKRVAIAALGKIGSSPETSSEINDDDKAVIAAGLTHTNRAVQMAAKGALQRLSAN